MDQLTVVLVVLGFGAIGLAGRLLDTRQVVRFGGLYSARELVEPDWPIGVQEADPPRLAMERWRPRGPNPQIEPALPMRIPAKSVTIGRPRRRASQADAPEQT